jgi:hypothetical protein
MAGNLNVSKLQRMIKSKGFVTAFCAILAVLVLVIGYNIRIKDATKPVRVPVAAEKLSSRHQITEADITTIEMPKSALGGDYYGNEAYVIGQYVNIDTTIPKGSLFYRGSVVTAEELPDEALLNVKEGETLYYLTVNMLTSYTNSIIPNRYIDIYISTREGDKALVGKLLKNVKVLQVKTADGLNVFENSEESRTPYVIMFSLPESLHLLMRKIDAINNYSISADDSGFARLDVIPIPTTAYAKDEGEDFEPEVASDYLENYILNLAASIPENEKNVDFVPAVNNNNNNEENSEDTE